MKKRLILSLFIATFIFWIVPISIHWGTPAQSTEKPWTEGKGISPTKSGIDAAALNRTFTDLASQLSPTVVNIYTKSNIPMPRQNPFGGEDDIFRFFFGNPFGERQGPPRSRQAQSMGSGFVINKDGVIVTNSHVVTMGGRRADSIMVKFIHDPENSEGAEATVLGIDETTDVAVLKLKKKRNDLAFAIFGDSDKIQVGEWVIAIGNPYGHTHSVTKGIISALSRSIDINQRADFIQTDASINPGNSGGPLFNLYGEVIGINTAIDARAQGIGFAIPINTAKNVVQQIVEKGRVSLGWIGVMVDDLNPQVAASLNLPEDTEGVLIAEAIRGEPADKAGVQPYDIVTHVGGKSIKNKREFMIAISSLPIGTVTEIKVLRDGKPVSLKVKIAQRKTEAELANAAPAPSKSRPNPSSGKTGMLLSELSPELRRQLRLEPELRGVLVHQIISGGLAEEAGVRPGDVITEINRKSVRTIADAERALKAKSDSFLLKLTRGTASVIILLDLSDSEKPSENQEESE
jgi:serine protease Do